jgi:hypothetical protein
VLYFFSSIHSSSMCLAGSARQGLLSP